MSRVAGCVPATRESDRDETGTYCLAGVRVRISSLHDDVHRLCAEYRCSGEADLVVSTTQGDIDFERERAAGSWPGPTPPSDAYLETLAAYRQVAEAMPSRGVMLVHGSCLAVDGEAYLFCAPSGTGKSTHARLWRELLGERVTMVNDDKPLVRIEKGRAIAYGTPWDGKHRLSSPVAVPLRSVCILRRSEANAIEPAQARDVRADLLRHIYRPMDPGALAQTLSLADALASRVGLWRLGCNKDVEAAQISYAAMSGGSS